ncbi:hypothetical protein SIN8267_01418 [Sinobacterium norvegicum]|uniref:Lipoprotein n=1 Tax=Sinobacterium norvegicum TaxID=1641715 RepID=A0ABN8EI18_9GAMM|nr:hypothetical protein [Sinobacterium norvegicum]CAH0991315.1 hypothetical protein SIN8267_01418 [Sinobacterium norvegicum]
MLRFFGATILMLSTMAVMAQPQVLVIDSKLWPKSPDRYINKVHREISVQGLSAAQIRFVILEGMVTTRGYAWQYEGEGDGFILARFDYRGDTNIMKVAFNNNMIQLQYDQAWGDLVCKNNVEGICYKNAGGYYKYVRNLRNSIEQQAKQLLGEKK